MGFCGMLLSASLALSSSLDSVLMKICRIGVQHFFVLSTFKTFWIDVVFSRSRTVNSDASISSIWKKSSSPSICLSLLIFLSLWRISSSRKWRTFIRSFRSPLRDKNVKQVPRDLFPTWKSIRSRLYARHLRRHLNQSRSQSIRCLLSFFSGLWRKDSE